MAPSKKRALKKNSHSLEVLLTSDKSELLNIDLHDRLATFFSDPTFWSQVPDSEKSYIRTLIPPYLELNDDGSLPPQYLKYNSEFRLQCRTLQEDLRAGRMDPEWQRQAHEAMRERAEGKFDTWKEKEYEEHWGQKQRVGRKVLAGHASKVTLGELLAEQLFRVGDVWCFSHSFGRGEGNRVVVEKECKITALTSETITLAIPPAQLKFARLNSNPDQTLSSPSAPFTADTTNENADPSTYDAIPLTITTLTTLERKILAIDGRNPQGRSPNTWRVTRCFRNEQDLGSLFEMRDAYYVYRCG